MSRTGKKAHENQRRLLAPALKYAIGSEKLATQVNSHFFTSKQSVRRLTDIFFETSMNLANQWNKLVEDSGAQETEIEITNWAGRFA
jgi:hypothetical protein